MAGQGGRTGGPPWDNAGNRGDACSWRSLAHAQQDLAQRGTEVLAVPCNVTNQEQGHSLVDQAT